MMIEQTYTKIYANPCEERCLEKKQGVWKRPLTKQEQKKYNRYGRWQHIFIILTMLMAATGLVLCCLVDTLSLLPWLPIGLGLIAATIAPIYAASHLSDKKRHYLDGLRKKSFLHERANLNKHNKSETQKARLWMLYLALRSNHKYY